MTSGPFDFLNTSIVFWEALSWLVVLAMAPLVFRALRRQRGGSARDALDRRYASGEITREEYLTIRDDITRNPDA